MADYSQFEEGGMPENFLTNIYGKCTRRGLWFLA